MAEEGEYWIFTYRHRKIEQCCFTLQSFIIYSEEKLLLWLLPLYSSMTTWLAGSCVITHLKCSSGRQQMQIIQLPKEKSTFPQVLLTGVSIILSNLCNDSEGRFNNRNTSLSNVTPFNSSLFISRCCICFETLPQLHHQTWKLHFWVLVAMETISNPAATASALFQQLWYGHVRLLYSAFCSTVLQFGPCSPFSTLHFHWLFVTRLSVHF